GPVGSDTLSATGKMRWNASADVTATTPAVASDRRKMTATMKNVSNVKLIRNPTKSMSTTDSANASHVPSARPVACQSMASVDPLPVRAALAISSSESATITTPYQNGKKAGPGPSRV